MKRAPARRPSPGADDFPTSFGEAMSQSCEPILHGQPTYAPEMSFIVRRQIVFSDERGRGDEDVGVPDQLAPPIKIGVYFRCPGNGLIREWEDDVHITKPLERILLPRCALRLESPQYLISCDCRKRVVVMLIEVLPLSRQNSGVPPQNRGQDIGVHND